jgi:acetoin utilization deacetylase AcuC-like enzyme
MLHELEPGQLETASRLTRIKEALEISDISYKYKEARPATDEEILAAHSESLLNQMSKTSSMAKYVFAPDTSANMFTYDAAKTSAGGAIQMAEQLNSQSGFSMLRPPGHHATPESAMGFCFFNNVALAALALQKVNTKRVAIIDVDNHHGNGTQDIFRTNPNVLYTSLHADPQISYPGTGFADDVGFGEGMGKSVNFPLPFLTGDQDYLIAFDEVITPIVHEFNPDVILISLGVDGLKNDPYGQLSLSTNVFYEIGQRINDLNSRSTNNNVGVVLEGGYKYDEIGLATVEFFRGLLGYYKNDRIEPKLSTKLEYTLRNVKAIQRSHWIGI